MALSATFPPNARPQPLLNDLDKYPTILKLVKSPQVVEEQKSAPQAPKDYVGNKNIGLL